MSQQVVGTVRVSLTANTASFNTGMAAASATAKQTASDVKSSFDTVDFGQSRAGAMLLNEELGIKLPRHLTSLIATLPGVGAAFATALPIIAITVFATKIAELVEHFSKVGEVARKAALEQSALATTISKTFNSLDEKMLQVGIKTDELNNNHVAALKKQLQLIDMQSMSQLSATFDMLAEHAQKTLDGLKASWYQVGIGSEGAKNALTEFQGKYDSLIAQGKQSEATDLLSGTLKSAQKVLELQKQYKDNDPINDTSKHQGDFEKFAEASNELHKQNLSGSDAELKSQQALVDTLQAQLGVQQKVAVIKKGETGNATTEEHNTVAAIQQRITDELQKHKDEQNAINVLVDKEAQDAAAHVIKLQEAQGLITKIQADQQLTALYAKNETDELANKNAELTTQAALVQSLGDKTKNGTAGTERDKEAYNRALSEYNKFLLQKEQLQAASNAKQDAAEVDAAAKQVAAQALITSELQKHAKEQEAINELTAKDAVTAQEHIIRMQEASGIITKIQADSRIAVLYAQSELDAETKKNTQLEKQASLVKQLGSLTNSGTTGTDADRAAYNKALTDYQTFLLEKEKAKQASDAKMYKAEEDEIAKETAERNRAIGVMESTFNSGVMSVLQGNATIGQAAEKMWSNLASNAITAMMQMAEQEIIGLALHESIALTEKELHAKNAFHGAYDATAGIPIIGPALAPIAGATAYAAVMAFNKGGDVPGFGFGDSVPAMLTPREMVLPTHIADVVRNAAAGGGSGGNGRQNVTYAPNINGGLDSAASIEARLKPHFQNFIQSEMRKRYGRA